MPLLQVLLSLLLVVCMAAARPQLPDPLLGSGARDEYHPATHLVVEVPAVPQLGFPDDKLGFFGEVYDTPHHVPGGTLNPHHTHA